MKVELTDILQVTTKDRQSKLVSIADILELVTKPAEATDVVERINEVATGTDAILRDHDDRICILESECELRPKAPPEPEPEPELIKEEKSAPKKGKDK